MNKERSLLPWILGGLSIATVAAAITVTSVRRPITASTTPPSLVAPTAPSVLLPAPPVSPSPAQNPVGVTLQETAPAEPPAHRGQIWECTTNGVKTFSSNPCGEKSTRLAVRAINIMNPTPEVHYARPYAAEEPRYAPESYPDAGSGEYAGPYYEFAPGFVFLPRHRPEHDRRPHQWSRGPTPHHGAGAAVHRN